MTKCLNNYFKYNKGSENIICILALITIVFYENIYCIITYVMNTFTMHVYLKMLCKVLPVYMDLKIFRYLYWNTIQNTKQKIHLCSVFKA